MKQVELTPKDYLQIKSGATKLFVDNSVTHENFATECLIQSFLTFINSKGYVVKNGILYYAEEKNRADDSSGV